MYERVSRLVTVLAGVSVCVCRYACVGECMSVSRLVTVLAGVSVSLTMYQS